MTEVDTNGEKITLPTAKAEHVLEKIDITKKKISIPETVEVMVKPRGKKNLEPRTYEVRQETVRGLISLSKMFFKQHTDFLEELYKELENKGGRKPPEVGETRRYSLDPKRKGFYVPVHFIWNGNDTDRTGFARATFNADHIVVKVEKITDPPLPSDSAKT